MRRQYRDLANSIGHIPRHQTLPSRKPCNSLGLCVCIRTNGRSLFSNCDRRCSLSSWCQGSSAISSRHSMWCDHQLASYPPAQVTSKCHSSSGVVTSGRSFLQTPHEEFDPSLKRLPRHSCRQRPDPSLPGSCRWFQGQRTKPR